MQVAVGEVQSAVLGAGILAGLLFTNEGILVLGFRLKDDEWKAFSVEQEKINKTSFRFLKILSEFIKIGCLYRNRHFQSDIGRLFCFRKESPPGCFKQFVNLNAGGGFF